jgi:NAD(P)-dependent dehydrogenase (short-subunit alcohol dehydrogenase family)
MGRLEGKVAIVTGATSGMGKRTAERFVEEGAIVVLAGRREAEGEEAARSLGPRAHFVRTDVAREDDVRRLVEGTVARHGRLDCLFNNAGGPGPRGGIATIPLDGAERSMAVNFGGVLLGMKHAAPIMVRQRSGSIINNASVAASRAGYSSSMIYSAAKAAVVQLSRWRWSSGAQRARELHLAGRDRHRHPAEGPRAPHDRADDVSVNLTERFAAQQPIPRAGSVDDIAHMAVFLASDESTFVTGQDIVVDGGQISGRLWTPQQEGLRQLRQAFGLQAEG